MGKTALVIALVAVAAGRAKGGGTRVGVGQFWGVADVRWWCDGGVQPDAKPRRLGHL